MRMELHDKGLVLSAPEIPVKAVQPAGGQSRPPLQDALDVQRQNF